MDQRPDLAGRVAWTYLATILAAAVGGLVALVAFQVADPAVCVVTSEDLAEQQLTCSLVLGMGLWVVGFAAAMIGSLRLLKVGARLGAWLAMVAGLVGLLVGVAYLGQWWWWLAMVLLPAAAALASAPWWRGSRARLLHQGVLAALAALAVGTFVWQVVTAQA